MVFYYDLQEVTTISFDDDSRESHLITGMLDESLMDKDEKLFPTTLENLFQGHLYQRTYESEKAQAGYACTLLEVSDGKV